MACQTCNDSLSSYKLSAKVYLNALKSLRGLVGEEHRLAAQEAQQLKLESERIGDALMDHWHQDHPELAKSGNRGYSLTQAIADQ
jgi:hypothetical protein